jgi:hypothetical protein
VASWSLHCGVDIFTFEAADISISLYKSAFDGNPCTNLVSGELFELDLARSRSICSFAGHGLLIGYSSERVLVFHQY